MFALLLVGLEKNDRSHICVLYKFSLFVVVLAIAAADCPSDGTWAVTRPGSIAVANCQGETVGEMTRECLSTGSWGAINTTYCLPKWPENGYAHVDFVLFIMRGRYDTISKRPEGIKAAILSAINTVDESAIFVHRIAENVENSYVSVQIRVTDIESRANQFYRQLNDEFLEKFLQYLLDNNTEREKLNFLTETTTANVTFKSNPIYQAAKPKNTTAIVVIVVCVIIGVIVLVIVGFYVWLQIKRSSSKNGSKQLKNTSKV